MTKKQAEPLVTTLEGLLLGYCCVGYVWAKSNKNIEIIGLRCVIAAYILLSACYALIYQKANLLDFLMIYKSFVYLYFLSFLTNKRLMEGNYILKFYDILLGIFFLKYMIVLVFGFSDRPIVYDENNFELMILYALYLVRFSITKEKFLVYLFIVGLITVLSLSRSSLIMFSVLAVYIYYSSFKRTWVFIMPIIGVVLGWVIYYIFSQRSSSIEDVDRYRFMLVFLNEVKGWSILDWITGRGRITPLSYGACQTMSYWANLFSYSGNGTCYSVVLHSFLLRVILDHGIIGLIFIIYSTYHLLKGSGVQKAFIWIFIAIVFLNGVSVSSFNSLFFAISMVFLMTTNRESKIKRYSNAHNMQLN